MGTHSKKNETKNDLYPNYLFFPFQHLVIWSFRFTKNPSQQLNTLGSIHSIEYATYAFEATYVLMLPTRFVIVKRTMFKG